jgi:hypothetical protein
VVQGFEHEHLSERQPCWRALRSLDQMLYGVLPVGFGLLKAGLNLKERDAIEWPIPIIGLSIKK